jgi:hypothetical protein
MEIRNRLFPYPVLCSETDDYEGNLTVLFNQKDSMNDINVEVYFELENQAMLDLIRNGYAEYVVHLECSSTSYRRVIKSYASQISFSFPKSRVNNEVTVLAMIVAKRRIQNYVSDDLNEDYDDESITFEKASILAYNNLPRIYIYKNYEELAENESLFSVIKVGLPGEEPKPISFDLNSDRIKIFVDSDTYKAYIHYQHKPAIAMSMLVLPALLYVIDELKENFDSFERQMWFVKMKQFYKAQGKDFREDIIFSGRNAVEIAQDMLKCPIGKAYREMLEDEI